jgi:hypothetical protein
MLIIASIGAGLFVVVEALRWRLRPAARRLRVIRKIGGR